jgi:mono/diheme cytochrome c family protein
MKIVLVSLISWLAAIILTGSVGARAAEAEWNDMPVPYEDADSVLKGKERFSERCAFCHGGGGRGAKYGNIAAGVPGTQMGAFGTTLSQEEINNILAFMRAEQFKKEAADGAENK